MQHNGPIGNAKRNWRFPLLLAVLLIGAPVGIRSLGLERGALVAFDAAAVAFLASSASLLFHKTQDIRAAATANDAGRVLRLTIGLMLAVVVFAAMAAVIVDPERLTGFDKGLVTVTIALVWLFANTMYALHYAHLYYSSADDGQDCKGLTFPGASEPLMADFAYFAFTIGVALQTADVSISSARIRRVVTGHELVAFAFNIGVLALTINVLGSS